MKHLSQSLSSEVAAVNFAWFIPSDCALCGREQLPAGGFAGALLSQITSGTFSPLPSELTQRAGFAGTFIPARKEGKLQCPEEKYPGAEMRKRHSKTSVRGVHYQGRER